MPIPVQQYGILTPAQMGSYGAAFKEGLSNYKDIVGAAYEKPRQQSDILSKTAYAAYTPPTYAVKALSDPMIYASMTPEERQQMLHTITSAPANSMDILNRPSEGSSQPSPLQHAWESIKSTFGGSAPQQPQTTNNYSVPASQGGPPEDLRNSPMPASNTGSGSVPMSQADMQNAAFIQKFPNSPQAQQFQAEKKRQIEEAKIQTDALQKYQDAGSAMSQSAFNMELNADKFHQSYQDAFVKGPLTGLPGIRKLAEFDPNTVQAMNSANNMAVDLASQLFGTKQSDYREKLAQTLKLSTTMPEKAEQNIYSGIKAQAERVKEKNDFNRYAIDTLGIKNPNKIENMWFDYNVDRPFYDVKNKRVIQKNIGSYEDYLDNKFNKKKSTKAENPALDKAGTGEEYTELDGKQYQNINGQWVPV